ncbi:unnamed protein product [Urochloa decumbens]|uniref:Uncharacterized protein n=1 Tax=Urochloa decumbens TaxID=240449 RepID=A0ABC8VHC4_9POAL
MAGGADALAVVQQQRVPLHGGGDDARPVRAVARRRQGRPRARRTRPRLRAQPPRLQRRLRHRQRQVHAGAGRRRAGVRHHRRRRQHRGHRRQLHQAAAELLGVQGGELRARHNGDQEPDARLLRVAPQPGRRQGRRRRGLAHKQVLDAHQRRHQLIADPTSIPTTALVTENEIEQPVPLEIKFSEKMAQILAIS